MCNLEMSNHHFRCSRYLRQQPLFKFAIQTQSNSTVVQAAAEPQSKRYYKVCLESVRTEVKPFLKKEGGIHLKISNLNIGDVFQSTKLYTFQSTTYQAFTAATTLKRWFGVVLERV